MAVTIMFGLVWVPRADHNRGAGTCTRSSTRCTRCRLPRRVEPGSRRRDADQAALQHAICKLIVAAHGVDRVTPRVLGAGHATEPRSGGPCSRHSSRRVGGVEGAPHREHCAASSAGGAPQHAVGVTNPRHPAGPAHQAEGTTPQHPRSVIWDRARQAEEVGDATEDQLRANRDQHETTSVQSEPPGTSA
jgi:hypothetical protein